MAGSLRGRKRRDKSSSDADSDSPQVTTDLDNELSDVELYSKNVLNNLITDNLPPTPNNFSLYFDRYLESKDEGFRKQILSMLELEDANDNENTFALEQDLKKGFSSVKTILVLTANLYKNMSLMTKILDKRKHELSQDMDVPNAMSIMQNLENDVSKLSTILKTQSTQMKAVYDETAVIIKNVEKETVFDNQYGVYNKRYLLNKLDHEIELISQFEHSSSLIMIELSKELKYMVKNEKAIISMTRTLSRLLLKTSRRSDIVSHYGNGVFAMLLKHTNVESAKKASERLCYLVSNSNFFLADREFQLKISIGVTNISSLHTVEEIIVKAIDAIEEAYKQKDTNYSVLLND